MNHIIPDRFGIYDDLPKQSDGIEERSLSGRAPELVQKWKGFRALQPLHDRVLVHRFGEEAFRGGIFIPGAARQKSSTGRVIAVGPGKKDADGVFQETMVRAGDVVVFSQSVNFPYPDLVEDGQLVMMAEADILGILRATARRKKAKGG